MRRQTGGGPSGLSVSLREQANKRREAMTAIAVIGPGAIGATIALRLIGTGHHEITLCARSPTPELTIEDSDGVHTVSPVTLVSPEAATVVDWVFVATKAYDSAGTVGWLRALVGPATRIAILQNGVEQVARFAPYVPVEQLVPVIVNMPVERISTGRFHQRRKGQLTVPTGEDGARFADLFGLTSIGVATTPDFQTEAWRKLALNCAGAVSALVLKPAGIAKNDAVADIMRALILECITVGRKEGAILDVALVEQIIESYRSGPPDAINSMHADRIAGRQMEVDARNGAVVRFGLKHGISTPVNHLIVTLLQTAAHTA